MFVLTTNFPKKKMDVLISDLLTGRTNISLPKPQADYSPISQCQNV